MMKRLLLASFALYIIYWIILEHTNDWLIRFEDEEASVCYGLANSGSIDYPKRLPSKGVNFDYANRLSMTLGSNKVHTQIRDIVNETFFELSRQHPQYHYLIAKAWNTKKAENENSDRHLNGTAIDFIVPIQHSNPEIFYAPTNLLNRFGERLSFNEKGEGDNFQIDTNALLRHLQFLNAAATNHKLRLGRVVVHQDVLTLLNANTLFENISEKVDIASEAAWNQPRGVYHVEIRGLCKSPSVPLN